MGLTPGVPLTPPPLGGLAWALALSQAWALLCFLQALYRENILAVSTVPVDLAKMFSG